MNNIKFLKNRVNDSENLNSYTASLNAFRNDNKAWLALLT